MMQALAESLLVTEGAGLPISIVRPSIVAASLREPVPGTCPISIVRPSIVAAFLREQVPVTYPNSIVRPSTVASARTGSK